MSDDSIGGCVLLVVIWAKDLDVVRLVGKGRGTSDAETKLSIKTG